MKTVLLREYFRERAKMCEDLRKLTLAKDITDHIEFIDHGDEAIQMGITLSSVRFLTPREAERYAQCIETASKLAKDFKYNGYTTTTEE